MMYLSLLAIIGTIMLYSASWYESFLSTNGDSEMLFLKNHLKRLLLGMAFLVGFLLFDYRALKHIAPYLIIFSLLLLILTMMRFQTYH